MSIVALTNFIRVQTRSAAPEVKYNFHNANPGTYIVHDGWGHEYLSFAYRGGVMNRSGDAIEATLVLGANALALERVEEIVTQRWGVYVSTCQMNLDFTTPRDINREYWVATSASYDNTAIQVQLSSPIDAVDTQVPNIFLTQHNVGRLPVTGALSNY